MEFANCAALADILYTVA